MRKRTLGVVLLAGLAMSGAGAFTGSNAMPSGSATATAGYGEVTASGVTVTDSKYLLSTDNSSVDEIRFVVSQGSLSGLTSHVTLTNSGTVVTEMDCTNLSGSSAGDVVTAAALTPSVVLTATTSLIQCDFSSAQALTSFNKTGLTVYTTGFAS